MVQCVAAIIIARHTIEQSTCCRPVWSCGEAYTTARGHDGNRGVFKLYPKKFLSSNMGVRELSEAVAEHQSFSHAQTFVLGPHSGVRSRSFRSMRSRPKMATRMREQLEVSSDLTKRSGLTFSRLREAKNSQRRLYLSLASSKFLHA